MQPPDTLPAICPSSRTATTEPTSSPVNLFRYQAVAVSIYGEIDGRSVSMDIGMPVAPFQRWNACQTFPDAQSAATLARKYSNQEMQYAVTKDGVIKLTDFGLARIYDFYTLLTSVVSQRLPQLGGGA